MESLLSLKFLENNTIRSYDCHLLDDDQLEIISFCDNEIIGKINLNSEQLKNLIIFIDEQNISEIEINDINIKTSYLKNLNCLCE
jgi:hypothetical protein